MIGRALTVAVLRRRPTASQPLTPPERGERHACARREIPLRLMQLCGEDGGVAVKGDAFAAGDLVRADLTINSPVENRT